MGRERIEVEGNWSIPCPQCGCVHKLTGKDLGVSLGCAGCGSEFIFDEPLRQKQAELRARQHAERAAERFEASERNRERLRRALVTLRRSWALRIALVSFAVVAIVALSVSRYRQSQREEEKRRNAGQAAKQEADRQAESEARLARAKAASEWLLNDSNKNVLSMMQNLERSGYDAGQWARVVYGVVDLISRTGVKPKDAEAAMLAEKLDSAAAERRLAIDRGCEIRKSEVLRDKNYLSASYSDQRAIIESLEELRFSYINAPVHERRGRESFVRMAELLSASWIEEADAYRSRFQNTSYPVGELPPPLEGPVAPPPLGQPAVLRQCPVCGSTISYSVSEWESRQRDKSLKRPEICGPCTEHERRRAVKEGRAARW